MILAGSTTGEIVFTAIQDLIEEGGEGIDWTLDSVTNAGTGTMTGGSINILDDDVAILEITLSTGSIAES